MITGSASVMEAGVILRLHVQVKVTVNVQII